MALFIGIEKESSNEQFVELHNQGIQALQDWHQRSRIRNRLLIRLELIRTAECSKATSHHRRHASYFQDRAE